MITLLENFVLSFEIKSISRGVMVSFPYSRMRDNVFQRNVNFLDYNILISKMIELCSVIFRIST